MNARAFKPSPIRCRRCKGTIKGTIYFDHSGTLCIDCASEWFAGERWWGNSWKPGGRTPPETSPCQVCGRPMASSAEIAAVAFLDATVMGVEICSERCQAERKKARRRVRQTPRPCIACGEDFIPTRSDAKTCSDRCRQRLHRDRLLPDAVTRSGLEPASEV